MTLGTVLLDIGGGFITLGGMYDIFTPTLPVNLLQRAGDSVTSRRLVRDLLRALGGCLVASGVSVIILANLAIRTHQTGPLWVIVVLVVPSEGVNSLGMFRSGSPYLIPLVFIALVLLGVWLS